MTSTKGTLARTTTPSPAVGSGRKGTARSAATKVRRLASARRATRSPYISSQIISKLGECERQKEHCLADQRWIKDGQPLVANFPLEIVLLSPGA